MPRQGLQCRWLYHADLSNSKQIKLLVYTNLIFWGEDNDVREDDVDIRKGNEDTRLRFLVFLKQ